MAKKELKYNRIYAYTTEDMKVIEWKGARKGRGLIKVGQTRDLTADNRIRPQLQGSPLVLLNNSFEILLDEEALDINGKYFKDKDVHRVLKAMHIERIKRTEWFECTLEEVKQALALLKSGGSAKNIAKTSGKKSKPVRSKEASAERNKLLNEYYTLEVMRKYKEATTAKGIGKCLYKYLDIKHYSPTTISYIIIPSVIQSLLEKGVIKNSGNNAFGTCYELTGRSSVVPAVKKTKKSVFNSSRVIPFLEKCAVGATIKDFREEFDIKEGNASLHSKLERITRKINVKDEKGKVYSRFFSPDKKILLPENEEIVEEIRTCHQDVSRHRRYLKNVLKEKLTQMYGRILVSDIFPKNCDTTLLKSVLLQYFPKYLLAEKKNKLYVYYNKYYKATNDNKYEKELNLKIQKILDMLDRERRVDADQIKRKLGISRSSASRIMKEVLKRSSSVFLTQDRPLGSKSARYYLTLDQPLISEVMSALPMEHRWRLKSKGINEDTFIEIVRKNPGINATEIESILNKKHGETFKSEVSSMIKSLLQAGKLADIGHYPSRKLYIQDGSYESTILLRTPIEDYLDCIKSREGLTIRELYEALHPTCHIANLYLKLRKVKEVCLVRVYSESTKKEFYRVFSSRDKVVIPEGEVSLEWMG